MSLFKHPDPRAWKKLYEEWRKDHLDKTKEWRAARVRGCLGKIRYPRRIMAELEAQKLPPREGKVLGVYRCDICGGWHIGNSRFEKRF